MSTTIEYRTITAGTPGELDRLLNESASEGFELEHALVHKDKIWGVMSKITPEMTMPAQEGYTFDAEPASMLEEVPSHEA